MISHIHIKDFAIIENVEIDFYDGLNIITGETGAGKSIVIEAISLALGSRADSTFVRSGKHKAVIQFAADLNGEDVVIMREISATGKNLCKINGEIVTLTQLNALCKKIADIHGQYDHQSLLNPDNHIRFVDAYKNSEITPAKERVASVYTKYKEIKNSLAGVVSGFEENTRKRDFMKFELDEIRKANLVIHEDDKLLNEIHLLQNSEKIVRNLSNAYAISYEESPSALDGLKKALELLQDLTDFSPELSSVTSEFTDTYYKLEDLCKEIRRFRDRISFSEEALDNALSRLELIDALKRKYGDTIEKILTYADDLEQQLSVIENIDEVKEKLTAQLAASEDELKKSSQALSKLRKESAKELESKIISELKELNFNDSSLSIDFLPANGYTEDGIDRIEFLISTNKGEPLKPLSKIASGGEMSRIMLAFKKIIGDYDEIATMIFDEIDSGISGIAASVVGKKLTQIAEKHQIICITHLPQIAAFGKHNYKIRKTSDDNTTFTTIEELDEHQKILEIARLLGGINVTDKTLESARELVEFSEK